MSFFCWSLAANNGSFLSMYMHSIAQDLGWELDLGFSSVRAEPEQRGHRQENLVPSDAHTPWLQKIRHPSKWRYICLQIAIKIPMLCGKTSAVKEHNAFFALWMGLEWQQALPLSWRAKAVAHLGCASTSKCGKTRALHNGYPFWDEQGPRNQQSHEHSFLMLIMVTAAGIM